MSDTQNTPWYPPGEGWVEWNGGKNPVPGAVVERLWRIEREKRDYVSEPRQSNDVLWEDYVVAYRVVTPAPFTVDRALFDEMVEALALLDFHYPGGINPGLDEAAARARTVLAKAREAGK